MTEVPINSLRIAPLGEIRAYQITEEELAQLKEGSPTSLLLNFGLTFAGSSLSFLIALLSTSMSDRTFTVFVVFCVCFGIASIVSLALWRHSYRRQGNLADKIRSRMPPRTATAEAGFVVDEMQ